MSNRIQLLNFIDSRFNESELRTLCFSLNIDYDNLVGINKIDKIRELILYCERRGRMADLEAAVLQARPF